MTDFEYIKQVSQSDLTGRCNDVNNSLAKAWDTIFSPDEVDSFDASCNTCKHFVRKPMIPEEKKDRNIFGMPGHCTKKDIPIRGWQRGQFCGFENAECYENRRTAMTFSEACRPQE